MFPYDPVQFPGLEGEVLSCCCNTVLQSESLIQMKPEISDSVRLRISVVIKVEVGGISPSQRECDVCGFGFVHFKSPFLGPV